MTYQKPINVQRAQSLKRALCSPSFLPHPNRSTAILSPRAAATTPKSTTLPTWSATTGVVERNSVARFCATRSRAPTATATWTRTPRSCATTTMGARNKSAALKVFFLVNKEILASP